MDDQRIAPGEPVESRKMGSGWSNEMFRIRRGEEQLVLRRPAGQPLDGADRGMTREYRVLKALDGTEVPHPRALAICTDPEVLGCTFYLMEWVDGFTPTEPLPPRFREQEARRELAFAIVDALAELSRVDWRARGLEGFGRPSDFHERQVRRWIGQYRRYRRQELPGLEAAAEWISDRIPSRWAPAIMHGDYHMANLVVGPDLPARVAAICDWETATIGDPLLDLAGFLRFWLEVHSESDGWPGRDELIGRYATRAGREVSDLDYYSLLAQFRLAVTVEGIYQRSLDDPTRPVATDMHNYALMLADNMAKALAV